jgi:hypothetical protein
MSARMTLYRAISNGSFTLFRSAVNLGTTHGNGLREKRMAVQTPGAGFLSTRKEDGYFSPPDPPPTIFTEASERERIFLGIVSSR